MAKCKYGDIIVELRGAKGGAVYSKNKYGYYVKPNAVPINPTSTAQGKTRIAFSQFTKSWSSLSAGQRAGWDDLAAANPVVDVFGKTIYLTGANYYCKLNMNRVLNTTESTIIADSPDNIDVLSWIIPASDIVTTIDGNITGMSFENIPAYMITDPKHIIIVKTSPSLRPGQAVSPRGFKYYDQAPILMSPAITPQHDPDYNYKVGDDMLIDLSFYNSANGSISTSQKFRVTWASA